MMRQRLKQAQNTTGPWCVSVTGTASAPVKAIVASDTLTVILQLSIRSSDAVSQNSEFETNC